MDVEQGLTSIPEVDEHPLEHQDQPHPSHSFSIGALLGKMVHWLYHTLIHITLFVLQGLSMIFFLFGRILGTVFDVLLSRPAQWASHTNPGPAIATAKYMVIALTLYGAWYALRDPLQHILPYRPLKTAYSAPDVPAADIAELSARLQRIESVLTGLSQEHERAKSRQENALKNHVDLVGRLGSLESRVQRETARAVDAEMQVRTSTSQGLDTVRHQVEVLHAELEARSGQQNGEVGERGSDEEARARLKALEERVGSVEGGVKEALDIGKSSLKAGGVASSAGAAWWNKLASGGASTSGLTIKSADGQDVTSLIGHLVDSAVSHYGKDVLARPDFALHSGGAQIIPSLTSPTFEISPPNLRGQIVGFITGNGYAIGRPPITALHHELHNGHCWPFAGSEGQLGITLAAPTYISDVTIDHVAKETAFDMRSAPREMEVWALVEGKDNIAKVREWQAEKMKRQEEASVRAEEEGAEFVEEDAEVYPKTLPRAPQYIQIASFAYDINASNNIQTFPVSQEIRDLGVDFGIVVLRIKSNWGRKEFTCLYRLRVHGHRIGPSEELP
jgi:SUN domain-containing protein 1/2